MSYFVRITAAVVLTMKHVVKRCKWL